LSELQICDSFNSYSEGNDYSSNVLIFLLSFSKAKENENISLPPPQSGGGGEDREKKSLGQTEARKNIC